MNLTLKDRLEIRNFKALFTRELWNLDTTHSTKGWKRIVRGVQIVRMTFDNFAKKRMGFQCVSLSYFCTLAIVPLLAVVFAVTGGLGLSEVLSGFLLKILPSDVYGIIPWLMEKANVIINTAKSGWVGLVAALTFLWTILWMMFQVERVFNNVWGIQKIPRKIYKRFSFYFLIMFLIPFVLLVFCAGFILYTNIAGVLGMGLARVAKFVDILILYVISVFTFSVMYKYIPSPKIKYSNAFKASLLISLIFVLFQYIYLETQVFINRLNAVYGVMAAFPLFLIWLNFSWQIIMYGNQLTYSLERLDKGLTL